MIRKKAQDRHLSAMSSRGHCYFDLVCYWSHIPQIILKMLARLKIKPDEDKPKRLNQIKDKINLEILA